MAGKKKNEKKTDKDFRPGRGQQSNENWDDENNQFKDNPRQNEESSDKRVTDESGKGSGYGSSQRSKKDESVGPLDADFEELPSQKRSDRGSNLTGPGLG